MISAIYLIAAAKSYAITDRFAAEFLNAKLIILAKLLADEEASLYFKEQFSTITLELQKA